MENCMEDPNTWWTSRPLAGLPWVRHVYFHVHLPFARVGFFINFPSVFDTQPWSFRCDDLSTFACRRLFAKSHKNCVITNYFADNESRTKMFFTFSSKAHTQVKFELIHWNESHEVAGNCRVCLVDDSASCDYYSNMPIIIETIITNTHTHGVQRPWNFTRSFIHSMSCACLLFFFSPIHSWKARSSKIEVERWCACVHRNENLRCCFACGWKWIECMYGYWLIHIGSDAKKTPSNLQATLRNAAADIGRAARYFSFDWQQQWQRQSGRHACGWTWTHWDPFYNFFRMCFAQFSVAR